jgi:hypothetical protein
MAQVAELLRTKLQFKLQYCPHTQKQTPTVSVCWQVKKLELVVYTADTLEDSLAIHRNAKQSFHVT